MSSELLPTPENEKNRRKSVLIEMHRHRLIIEHSGGKKFHRHQTTTDSKRDRYYFAASFDLNKIFNFMKQRFVLQFRHSAVA